MWYYNIILLNEVLFMHLFYNEDQFKNKKKIIQQIVEMNDINYMFVLIPTNDSTIKNKWKELSYDLGINIMIMSFKQYINHRNKNKISSYKSYFNDYFNLIFDETLFIIDQFEYMNEPTTKTALLINKLVKSSNYNINFINHYNEGITSYYLINAFIIKNYYVNYTDFMSEQYINYSKIKNQHDLIALSDFKRHFLIYDNDQFKINKKYKQDLKNEYQLQQFLNAFIDN